VISAAENSNKFQKTRFWKEKSVDDVGTLGPTAQPTLVYLKRKVVPNISRNNLEDKFDHKHLSNDTLTLMMIYKFLGGCFTKSLALLCKWNLVIVMRVACMIVKP
jgi:hypothetical protein